MEVPLMKTAKSLTLTLALAAALALAACGGDTPSGSDSAPTRRPSQTQGATDPTPAPSEPTPDPQTGGDDRPVQPTPVPQHGEDGPTPAPPQNPAVTFTNPVIEEAVRAYANLGPDDEILRSHIRGIDTIAIGGSFNDDGYCRVNVSRSVTIVGEHEETGLTSFALDDLALFEGLIWLRIENLRIIESYAPLADLSPTLEYLRLERTAARDGGGLPSFERFTSLRILELAFIDGISALPAFPANKELEELMVYGCDNFTDLSAVSALNSMWSVSLTLCPRLSDISPLSSLSALRHIGISQTGITDISPLLQLRGLITVNLWMNPIPDLSILDELDAETVNYDE
jgi:hypothetical protein